MATEFPEEYLKALDKVIELSSFTTKYQVKGAEFSAAKSVKIPELVFDGGTTDYDRFKSEGRVELRCTSSLPAWERDRNTSVREWFLSGDCLRRHRPRRPPFPSSRDWRDLFRSKLSATNYLFLRPLG